MHYGPEAFWCLDLTKDIMNLENPEFILGGRFYASSVGAAKRVFERRNYARVVELADTLDLGSSAVRCAGSSPVPGTTPKALHQTSRMVLCLSR